MLQRSPQDPKLMDPADILSFYYLRDVLPDYPQPYEPYFKATAEAHKTLISREGIKSLTELVSRVGLDFVIESVRVFHASIPEKHKPNLIYFGNKPYEPFKIIKLYYRTHEADLFQRAHLSLLERAEFSPRQLAQDFFIKESTLAQNWEDLFRNTQHRELLKRYLEKELNPITILQIYYRSPETDKIVEEAHLKALSKSGGKITVASRKYSISPDRLYRFLRLRNIEYQVQTGPPNEAHVLSLFYRTQPAQNLLYQTLKKLLSTSTLKEIADKTGVKPKTIRRLLKKLKINPRLIQRI